MQYTTHSGPRRGAFAQFLGRRVLKAMGWELVGEFPDTPKGIFVASPHTSNLDGVLMVAASFSMGMKLSWMGKHTLFRFPFGGAIRFFGGVPVDRSKRSDTVKQVVGEFQERDGMYLAIAPAGTRSKRDFWKSGFYHIACEAGLPLICGCLDYGTKEAGLIGVVHPTGDPEVDMEAIREVYRGRTGKHPERMTPIRLRDSGARAPEEAHAVGHREQ